MCETIAPNCDFGYDYTQELNANNDYDKEPNYETQPLTEAPNEGRYIEYGPNRFFKEPNRSDNLWAVASRELTTIKPHFQVPDSFGFTASYPIPTDDGE